jgi:mono/diheme cytochrome c family protein
VKHGIKDTGMPSMAPGHSDKDVWAVAAFVRQLPTMSPERYDAMVKALQESGAGAGHESAGPKSGEEGGHGH